MRDTRGGREEGAGGGDREPRDRTPAPPADATQATATWKNPYSPAGKPGPGKRQPAQTSGPRPGHQRRPGADFWDYQKAGNYQLANKKPSAKFAYGLPKYSASGDDK